MLRRSSFVAGVMVVLMVLTASAQQRGARGRGLGFGGRGMRGPASTRNGIMLLRDPKVREELGTTDDQNAEIDGILDEIQASRLDRRGLQDLSGEERGKRFVEMQKKNEAANKRAEAAIAKVLDEKQQGRLNQLQLQLEGTNALLRADVAKQLDLSEEQETKMQEIQAKAMREGGVAFENFQQQSDEERQETFTKMQEREKKKAADILAVLTEDQQTKWAEIQGEKFDFPRQGPSGPGGGQGGRRGLGAGGGSGAGGERRRPSAKDSEE